jgi:hypothetical protein
MHFFSGIASLNITVAGFNASPRIMSRKLEDAVQKSRICTAVSELP